MIFGVIKSDNEVFSGDQIRFDFRESFLAPGKEFASISHEASVDSGANWYDVTSTKMLDWIFTSSGDKTIQLKLTITGDVSEITTKTVKVLNLTDAKLFSNDSDLYALEPEIDRFLPERWTSWNMIHLKAQRFILDWLDEKGFAKDNGAKYQVSDLLNIQEVKQFATCKALEIIFEGNSNVVGDIFSVKREKYRLMALEKASRSQLTLDKNIKEGDEPLDRTNMRVATLVRG